MDGTKLLKSQERGEASQTHQPVVEKMTWVYQTSRPMHHDLHSVLVSLSVAESKLTRETKQCLL